MAWDKTPAQREAVKSFFVMDGDKVDLDASVAKYRQAALRYMAGQEAEDQLITKCLNQLFDQYKGAHLNLDYVKSHTVALMVKAEPTLNEPGLYALLSKRVEDQLHELTGESDDKPFAMKRGKGGGFCRKVDQAPVQK